MAVEVDGVGQELREGGALAGEELPADGVAALDEAGCGAVEGGAVLFGDYGAGEDGGGVVCDLEVGGGADLRIAKTLERLGEGGGGKGGEFGGGGGAAEAGAVEAHDADHAEAVGRIGRGEGKGDAGDGGFGYCAGRLIFFGLEGLVGGGGHGFERAAVDVVEVQGVAMEGGGGAARGGGLKGRGEEQGDGFAGGFLPRLVRGQREQEEADSQRE